MQHLSLRRLQPGRGAKRFGASLLLQFDKGLKGRPGLKAWDLGPFR